MGQRQQTIGKVVEMLKNTCWGHFHQSLANDCILFLINGIGVVDFHTAVSLEAAEYLLISPPHSFRTQTFAYPESHAEREEILQGLQGRIEDIKSVSVVHVYKSTGHSCTHQDVPSPSSHLKIEYKI